MEVFYQGFVSFLHLVPRLCACFNPNIVSFTLTLAAENLVWFGASHLDFLSLPMFSSKHFDFWVVKMQTFFEIKT